MTFPVRLMLLWVFVVLQTTLSAARGGTLTDHQCHKATRAACVWVSSARSSIDGRHRRQEGKAHVGRTCQDADAECQYDSTCHVTGVSRDIYICKGKHDVGNILRQLTAGIRNRRHAIKAAEKHKPKPEHARVRRAVPSEEQNTEPSSRASDSGEMSRPDVEQRSKQTAESAHSSQQTADTRPDPQKVRGNKLPVVPVPALLKKIMQRHRANNVYAFNRGTYFLNGYSFMTPHKRAPPVTEADAAQKSISLKKSDTAQGADTD